MEPPPANHRAAKAHEALVDVGALVEACPQSPELMQQRDGLLHNVSENAQAAAVCLAATGDFRADAAARQAHAMLLGVVSAIAHHLLRLSQRGARLARDRRDRVDQRDQLRHVMAVGPGENGGKRHAAGIDDKVMFRAFFPAVHGAWSRFFPPCTARTDEESTITREKSISPAPRSLFSSSRWSWSQTPASRHSSRRFHSVMPQQPISWGKSSQGSPVLSTKMIPVRQTRSGTRGLPTPGVYGCFGRIGSTSSHSSSGTSGLLIVSSMTAMRPILTGMFRCGNGHF